LILTQTYTGRAGDALPWTRHGNTSTLAHQNEATLTGCTRNLEAIGRALTAYQRDHGELPPHLSDLHPEYLTDRALFHCPADRSEGSPGVGWATTDPGLPISYFFEMSLEPAPFPRNWLGPRQTGEKPTWRENKQGEQISFGDRVPVVRCFHHGHLHLNLTLAGEVYQDQGRWEDHPDTIATALARLGQALGGETGAFLSHWSFTSIEDYAARWIEAPLPPALRHLLGKLAERVHDAAPALPASLQGDAYRLAAGFWLGVGRTSEALAASETARQLPGNPERTASLHADLRHRLRGRRGAPPVDEYARSEMAKHHIPGLSVAVVRDGQIVLAKGYGLANVEWDLPAAADTVYALFSVTKQFTAAGVMLLVDAGRIALDDPVTCHLEGLPPAWDEVTIRQLLNHTSGIKSYSGLPEFMKLARLDVTHEEIIQRVAEFPLEFPPGEKFAYNNTGYYLLGMLIEKVSGSAYGDFLAGRIFQPLGMTATRLNDFREIIPKRASGYSWQDDRLRNADYYSPTQPFSAGSLVSTVSDMAKWDAALYTEKILRRETLEQMWERTRLADGTTVDYGLGWMIGHHRGRRVISHGGGYLGFLTMLSRFVDDRLTVILLTNLDSGDPGGMANRIASYYLRAAPPIPDTDPRTTRRLKQVLLDLAAGQADPDRFTPEARTALTSEQTQAFYAALGPLKSFRLIEQTGEGERRTYRYQARFGDTAWIQSLALTEAGQIAELGVAPE
jgi:D-alanyl-D-alanine carboxypeptidase